ncbi:6-methylsalicylic acid synthase [Lentzea xinjiangensis]|uniref:6-methylsalicylic acid synthase n=1 Tax=Lentzea xinjiangensis TaxID=402600 RepID=A0A1H9WFC6_9PSEU|nr:type I polyketide synthase [Lentzea xinjiangensis]SES32489.1 6-methylsalicylic acid synthase [Lentzea xinjiangensis]
MTRLNVGNPGNDVAVVGLGMRLAGGICEPADFWSRLIAARSEVGNLPRDRWSSYPAHGPAAVAAVNRAVSRAAYLENAADFDAEFFGVTPKEAVLMDPQQRLVLEVVWEALEHAGIPPLSLAGSNSAVLIGVGGGEYGQMLLNDPERIGPWSSIGGAYCAVANRVSYFLDLRGPSLALDSACSSSLAAIHFGRQALLSGECDVVIAGGVNLIAAPAQTLSLGASGALSADGRSKPFSASANGYGRGEGAGVVVLKRLDHARRDGDNVLAVVRASAVRQDGRTNGIMAPNGIAQQEMLRSVYETAGIDPSDVDYLEAHGTGTPLGDPTEAAAAAAVLGAGRTPDSPLLIGSVKGNVGHLEAGAGVVGIIKTVLAMRAGVLPPTVGARDGVNAEVEAEQSIKVVAEPTAWPEVPGKPKLAGVSSFGYGGTIAHVCLAEGDPLQPDGERGVTDDPSLLVLSAATREALAPTVSRLADALEAGDQDVSAVAATLTLHRSHLPWRTAVLAADRGEAVDRLRAWSATGKVPGVVHGRATDQAAGPVFVFSGHGSQWAGMGRELLRSSKPFAALCERLDPIFREEAGYSLINELEEGDCTRTDRIQATLFAMHLGLAEVWRSWGVEPVAALGHSMGEIAAAVTAGVWSAEDGARFACRRANLLKTVAGRGAMVLLDVPFDELEDRLAGTPGLTAAIEPARGWSVLAGDVAAVQEYAAVLADEGRVVRRVASDVAFHSSHMDELLDDLGAAVQGLSIGAPSLRLYGTILDDPRSDARRDAGYWQQNLRRPVRFAAGVEAAVHDGHHHFLEISPHPVVVHNIAQIAESLSVPAVTTAHSLRREQPVLAEMTEQLGRLHCAGVRVDWRAHWPRSVAVALPRTAWQHNRYWLPEAPADRGAGGHDPGSFTLLGSRLTAATTPPSAVWQTNLSPETRPYDAPHTVHGVDIVPASVLFCTLADAMTGEADRPRHLRDVVLRTPLPAEQNRAVQVVCQDGRAVLSSRLEEASEETTWTTHTSARDGGAGTLSADSAEVVEDSVLPKLPSGADGVLELLRPLGVSGLAFDWQVDHLRHDDDVVHATVSTPGRASHWAVILDAATTLSSLPLARQGIHRMPASVESVEWTGPALSSAHLVARLRSGTADTIDLDLRGADGQSAARVTGLRFGVLDADQTLLADPRIFLHGLSWQPLEVQAVETPAATVTLVSTEPSVAAERLAEHLVRAGLKCTLVKAAQDISLPAGDEPHHVVYLAPFSAPGHEYDATVHHLADLARVTQAVVEADRLGTRLWVLTREALACNISSGLTHRPLWGAARVIASEHPELRGGVLDLEGGDDDAAFELVARVLHEPPAEDWLVIQNGGLLAGRIVPRPDRAHTPPVPLRPDATYVVTGGLGALGLEAARHLSSRGARRLVLTSRRGLPPRSTWNEGHDAATRHAIGVVEELESQGVSVLPLALDVTDADAARAVLTPDFLRMPPIRGVVHTAGAVHGRLVDDLDEESIRETLHAKVLGALVLHELFPPGSIDEMVLFSSTAPLVVLPGCTAYAAANSFLDGLAAHRRHRGGNTTSIAWTVWRDTGMGKLTADGLQSMVAQGFGDITPSEALRVWNCLHTTDDGYALVVRPTTPPPGGRRALFEHVRDPQNGGSGGGGPTTEPVTLLRELPADEVLDAAMAVIQRVVAAETGVPEHRIEPERPFSDIGLDSVMGIAIRGKLQQSTGIELPAGILWTHPTPAALTRYLATMAAR